LKEVGNQAFILESCLCMKCILCGKRKAKRSCPAKEGMICTLCCGEKRVLEVHCPETCEFLRAGREHESAEFAKRLQSQDTRQQEKSRHVLAENQDVIAHLEYTIAQQRLASRHLSDRDVSTAVDILLDTYRTENKGVLYEKNSDNLLVDSLRRELRSVIERFRNPEGNEEKGIVDPVRDRLQLSKAIECLEFLQSMIAAFPDDRRSTSGYVDFLARMTPRKESSLSSIIVP
jgi:hypothetical protein